MGLPSALAYQTGELVQITKGDCSPAVAHVGGNVTITCGADAETVYWGTISNSDRVSDFETYFARYPGGVFTAQAKERLSMLRTKYGKAIAYVESAKEHLRAVEMGGSGTRIEEKRRLAFVDLSRAVELYPSYSDAHYVKAYALYMAPTPERKSDEAAIEEFDKAIDLAPNLPKAYLYRGFAYKRISEYKKACDDYIRFQQTAGFLTGAEVESAQLTGWLSRQFLESNGCTIPRNHVIGTPPLGAPLDCSSTITTVKLTQCADAGDPKAMYEEGKWAYVAKDYEKARQYWGALLERKHPLGYLGMGEFVNDGWAMPRDCRRAFDYYMNAAAAGLADAQYSVGIFYERGECVTKSIGTAQTWYSRAAVGGSQFASSRLNDIDRCRAATAQNEKVWCRD